MYDWATSAMQTGIMTAIFPIYFVRVVGANLPEGGATQRLATANSIALIFIAILSPILGELADYAAIKKRLMALFMFLGVGAIAAMFFIDRGDVTLASALFVLSLIGATGSFVFYEALLPHVARHDEIHSRLCAGVRWWWVTARAQSGLDSTP
jgi:UMF1 family MFS transporter